MPNVIGADVASAETRLRQDGFSTDTTQKTSDQPAGEVIGSDPAPGDQADEGSTVVLTVSGGPGTASVPSVEGLSRNGARARLRNAGFEIEERKESSDDVAEGKAIRTSPPEGDEQEKGSTITLLISTGPEQVAVPNVVGQSYDEASSKLEGAGFVVNRRDQVTDDEEPGTVLKQSPGSGRSIDKGSTITLAVAKEPTTVAVPDVTGETQSDAVTRLSQDGFEIQTEDREVDSPEGDGVVIEQDPPGGRAQRGSTVKIVVGRFNPALDPEGQTTPATPTTPTTPTTP